MVYVSNTMCYTPLTLKVHDSYRLVPCGRCLLCYASRRQQWFLRLKEEYKNACASYFVTLTYDDDSVVDEVTRKTIKLFHKRLRKLCLKYRHYTVGEYGSVSGRAHYHSLLFFPVNCSHSDLIIALEKAWTCGHVRASVCTDARINYTCKYVLKVGDKKGVMTCSQGIGKSFLTPAREAYYAGRKVDSYIAPGGSVRKLPRYYVNKIFVDRGLGYDHVFTPEYDCPDDYHAYKKEQEQRLLKIKKTIGYNEHF